MKKIFLLLAACTAIFASCSKEDANIQNSATTGDEMYVSFNVKAPASGVVTYTPVAAVATESAIHELHVYVFGPKEVPAGDPAEGTTDAYVLENKQVFKNLSASGETYDASDLQVTGRNVKRIYFVANRVPGATVGSTTETGFINSTVGSITAATGTQPYISLTGWGIDEVSGALKPAGWDTEMFKPGLPMSGFAEIDFSTGTPSGSTNVAMLRSVARIDVGNRTKNYTVTSVTVKSRSNGFNFPSKFNVTTGAYEGFLYPGIDALTLPATSAGTVRVDNGGYPNNAPTMIYAPIPTTVVPADEKLAVGYLYEAPAGDASVVIKCYNSASNTYRVIEIPFVQYGDAVAVNRNYVYRFEVTETETEDLEAGFVIVQWENAGIVKAIDENISAPVVFSAVDGDAGATLSGSTVIVPASGGTVTITASASGLPVVVAPYMDMNTVFGANPAFQWASGWTITSLGGGEYEISFTVEAASNAFQYSATIDMMGDLDIPGYYPVNTLTIRREPLI